MRRRRFTTRTLIKSPSSSFLHPWLLSPLSQAQTPKQDQGSSDDDDRRLSAKPVVHPTCCTTQDLAGSVRVWDWIGVRIGGRDGWRVGSDVASRPLG